MATERVAPKNIDAYIATFPSDVQKILEKIRTTIRKAVPDAEEAIAYQIPTFKLQGNLIHFAAFPKHIGLYPAPRENKEFAALLAEYKGGKGTVQFPLDKPIPYNVITKIVKFRAKENVEIAAAKGEKR